MGKLLRNPVLEPDEEWAPGNVLMRGTFKGHGDLRGVGHHGPPSSVDPQAAAGHGFTVHEQREREHACLRKPQIGDSEVHIDGRKPRCETDWLLTDVNRGHVVVQRFDLEGRFLGIVEGMLRRPCKIQQRGEYLVIPDLAGRVTILDGANELVTHLGDNPDPSLRAQNGVPRDKWKDGEFISPHSAVWDADGSLYVMDWNFLGRITKLRRVRPGATKQ